MAPGQSYGAAPGQLSVEKKELNTGSKMPEGILHLPLSDPGQVNASFNHLLVAATIAAPFTVYVIVSSLLTFKIHFHYHALTWGLVFLNLIPAAMAWTWRTKAYAQRDIFQAKWMTFLFLSIIGVWIAAVIVGTENYSGNMKRFYDITYLNTASSVDPSASSQQYIDTGRFLFHPDSFIDTSRAMGVRIGETYCAAPVVNSKTPVERRQYDFWAIGTSCCSAIQPQDQFHCGEIDNNYAYSGMRLMEDQSRAMYRMAVQEAEATYKISAKHPIFVDWMQDPSREMQGWYDHGLWVFWAGCFTVLVILGFLSVAAGLCFNAAVTRSYPCKGTGFVKSTAYNHWMDCESYDEESRHLISDDTKQVTL